MDNSIKPIKSSLLISTTFTVSNYQQRCHRCCSPKMTIDHREVAANDDKSRWVASIGIFAKQVPVRCVRFLQSVRWLVGRLGMYGNNRLSSSHGFATLGCLVVINWRATRLIASWRHYSRLLGDSFTARMGAGPILGGIMSLVMNGRL